MDGPKTKNGAGTNSGESGVRNLESESIRSGAESTGGCVKLKTVTEIRRSSARDTLTAESVYLVPGTDVDQEPILQLCAVWLFISRPNWITTVSKRSFSALTTFVK